MARATAPRAPASIDREQQRAGDLVRQVADDDQRPARRASAPPRNRRPARRRATISTRALAASSACEHAQHVGIALDRQDPARRRLARARARRQRPQTRRRSRPRRRRRPPPRRRRCAPAPSDRAGSSAPTTSWRAARAGRARGAGRRSRRQAGSAHSGSPGPLTAAVLARSQRQSRIDRQSSPGAHAARVELGPRGGDHRGVVGAALGRRDVEREAVLGAPPRPAPRATRGSPPHRRTRPARPGLPAPGPAATCAPTRRRPRPESWRRSRSVRTESAPLESSGERTRPPALRCAPADVDTAVFSPEKLKSRSSRPAQRARQRDGARVAAGGQLVDLHAARIAEAEQLADLVERLAGGVVARGAEELGCPGASTRISAVCPPETSSARCGYGGGPGSDGSSRTAAARCPARWLTPTSGLPSAKASALAVSTPTSSAPTRPGPAVTAIAIQVAKVDRPRRRPRCRNTGTMVGDVLARRHLGNDAAVERRGRRICEATTSARTRARPRPRPRRSHHTTSRCPGPTSRHAR